MIGTSARMLEIYKAIGRVAAQEWVQSTGPGTDIRAVAMITAQLRVRMLHAMAASGCHYIAWGLESASKEILTHASF